MSKLKRREAFQVIREEGLRSIQIGWKGRLLSKRRAHRVCAKLARKAAHKKIGVRHYGSLGVVPGVTVKG